MAKPQDNRKRDPRLNPSPPVHAPVKQARKSAPFSKFLADIGFPADIVWVSKAQEQARKEGKS